MTLPAAIPRSCFEFSVAGSCPCGAAESKFHSSGREDMDVRMLGTGEGEPLLLSLSVSGQRVASFVLLQFLQGGLLCWSCCSRTES